ncbi:hypothetical protein [Caenispirillum salinarum]|uniref:hypothetical protein n=1 Tax=Caenispirillum salinarum TaxID=859058 RepID=UPI00384ED1D7
MARASSSGGISPANLREMITMVVKAAREAGQTECVTHLLQARESVTPDSATGSKTAHR